MAQQSPVKPDDAVVFDLDGTLIDSAPDIHAAINVVLSESGQAPLSLPDVKSFIGNGVPKLVERAFRHHGVDLAGEKFKAAVARFSDVYTEDCATLTRPFPGIVEGLDHLKRAGVKLGVCTNKPHALSISILDALGLAPFFDTVIGGDSCKNKKPDPEPMMACLAALGTTPGSAIYIGDSETDVKTARAAGIPVLLVTYGYTPTPAKALGADATIDQVDNWARSKPPT